MKILAVIPARAGSKGIPNKKLTSYSLPTTLRGYARIFQIFEGLGSYCRTRGIKLYNCAPETLIQGIDKANFTTLFK